GDEDDVGMAEAAGGAGLALEALDELLVGHELGGDDLEGDGAAGAEVSGAVDGAHAAASAGLLDPVLALDDFPDDRLLIALLGDAIDGAGGKARGDRGRLEEAVLGCTGREQRLDF